MGHAWSVLDEQLGLTQTSDDSVEALRKQVEQMRQQLEEQAAKIEELEAQKPEEGVPDATPEPEPEPDAQ